MNHTDTIKVMTAIFCISLIITKGLNHVKEVKIDSEIIYEIVFTLPSLQTDCALRTDLQVGVIIIYVLIQPYERFHILDAVASKIHLHIENILRH